MNWKKFLKPDWRKILLTILIGILAFLIFMETGIYCKPCASETECVCPYSLPQLLSFPIFIIWAQSNDWIIISSSILYWYILSCLIVWIYDKVKKK
jgi:hypothetical protein